MTNTTSDQSVFSLPALLVTWASVPAVTDFLCHTVCKYIISPSLLLCLPPHQVSGTLAFVCLLLIRVLFGHHFPHWGARGGDRAVSEWLDRCRGWRAPQWAGTETRGAGREDAASCSASSITRAHWESRRAARQTSLRPICLQMWQGTDKRDGETRARQHLSQSVCQTLDTVRCSNASLPGSLQWVQADIFLLLAAGQARRATISTISVIASKHKRTCVPFSQSTQFVPLACYCCIQATELNICLVTRDGV